MNSDIMIAILTKLDREMKLKNQNVILYFLTMLLATDQIWRANFPTSRCVSYQRTKHHVYTRRAQEHAKSHHHFTIKSVAKLPYNPRIWIALLKAHFQLFMIVFGRWCTLRELRTRDLFENVSAPSFHLSLNLAGSGR